ncbi:MAG: hypothetical protein AMS27_04210 [Bacteroides sp. SM23_62_1]|nr:MAG: hypothetical protein AMS27_04210 [Bacteroides sp. SM23_62_1]
MEKSLTGLIIYKASAGSGKTHALTREYLRLALSNPGKYRGILAVTFTNKATAEMKERILSELYALAEGGTSSFRDEFLDNMNCNREQLRRTAREVLDQILHNYSRFHIETIDSFFQRIIRSFAREVHLQAVYNIELDDKRVLEEAVDRLISEVDRDKFLLDWLTDFADSKVREGLHWNLKFDILRFSEEISKEKFRESSGDLIKQLEDRETINRYLSNLYQYKNRFDNHLKELAGKAIQLIRDAGLSPDDFYKKDKGPAGFLLKLSQGTIITPSDYTRTFCDNPDTWYTRSSPVKELINQVYESGLNTYLKQIIQFWDQNFMIYNSVNYTRQYIYTLGILTDISRRMIDYLNERNLFLLSESSYFLKEIIGGNEAPFIYEKIGNYFNHYMIDEFQDTSRMQWQNFKPLLENSLAGNQSNLVVGDVKQSIYRWRNSDWEILSEGIENEFSRDLLDIRNLDENRRSRTNIIRFNNWLFQSARDIVAQKFEPIGGNNVINEDLTGKFVKAYSDVIQKLPSGQERQGGYVEVSFLTDEETGSWQDKADEKVISTIMMLQDRGYEPRDIAILVRKGDEGKRITNYILDYKTKSGKTDYTFDLISNELLYLSGSSAVRLIVSVMKFLVNPKDCINKSVILNEYNRYLGHGNKDFPLNELFLIASADDPEKFSACLPAGFNLITDELRYLSLIEITERIIALFGLHNMIPELPYIQAFQDIVMDYIRTGVSDISSFLDWWEDYGTGLSLNTSDEQNAIRVMTIHKAKGLQFRALIVPYCNWGLDHQVQPILWCRPDIHPFSELVMVPVRYSSGLQKTIFRDEYHQERFKIHVDNLNLLYVAFTRAQENLFVMTPYEPQKEENPRNVANLLGLLLTKDQNGDDMLKHFNSESKQWSIGEPEQPPVKDRKFPATTYISYAATNVRSRTGLRIHWHSMDFFDPDAEKKINYGKLMHEILQNMVSRADLDRAMEKFHREGKLSQSELESIHEEIMDFLDLSPVQNWFSGDYEVLNERDILMRDGHVRRPDRVMIKDKQIVVVDYKFGSSRLQKHQDQLIEYMNLIREMGYHDIKGFICYVKQKQIIPIIA